MVEAHSRSPDTKKQGHLSSINDSGYGGYEQLKSVLEDEFLLTGRRDVVEEKITETPAIITKSGGNGTILLTVVIGRYQILSLAGLLVPAVALLYTLPLMPYMGIKPEMMCAHSESPHDFFPCNTSEACISGTISKVNNTDSLINWVVSFNLQCQQSWLLDLAPFFFGTGFALGTGFLAPLADYLRRKPLILLACIVLSLVSLKGVFTFDLRMCCFLVFCAGLGSGVYYVVCMVYITETTTQQAAALFGTLFHTAFPLSGLAVTSLLQAYHDWKIVATVMAIVPLVLIAYFAYLAESPRFLATSLRFEEAGMAANKIARYNAHSVKLWVFEKDRCLYSKIYTDFEEKRFAKVFHHFYLCMNSSSRFYLITFGTLLLCCGIVSAALVHTFPPLVHSDYSSYAVLMTLYLAFIIIAAIVLQFAGHIHVILAGLGSTGLLLLLFSCLPSWKWLVWPALTTTVIATLGALTLAAECCPVRVRTTGFGSVLIFGLIGLMLGRIMQTPGGDLRMWCGLVAFMGLVPLRWTREPMWHRNNDDIYEIGEDCKRNFIGYKDRANPDTSITAQEAHVREEKELLAREERMLQALIESSKVPNPKFESKEANEPNAN